MGRVAALRVKRVFPAHRSLDMEPEILVRMRDTLRSLKAEGRLRHGEGVFLDDVTLEQVSAELGVPVVPVGGSGDELLSAMLGQDM